MQKICKICNKNLPKLRTVFCSDLCMKHPSNKKHWNPEKRTKICKTCDSQFIDNTNSSTKVTCSKNCQIIHGRSESYAKHNYINANELKKALLHRTSCELCKKEFKSISEKVVDHSHETKTFRGILCRKCNIGLGHFNDNLQTLKRSIDYISNHVTESPVHEIIRIMKKAYDRGWISSKDGNASILKDNKFYITPSGVTKYNITPSSIIVGSRENGEIILPQSTPSGELQMHIVLYQDPTINAVLHLHPTFTIAALHAGINLHNLEKDFAEISRFMRVAPNIPAIPPISLELADATKRALLTEPKYDIVGQTAHGVCAVGETLSECFEHIERLEHICQIVLASGVKPNDKNRIL